MGQSTEAVSLRITLRYKDIDEFVVRYAENISSAGLFIRTRSPKAAGTRIRFELLLSDGSRALRGEGVVVTARQGDKPGMVLRFHEVDPGSQQVIDRIVRAHGQGKLAPTPLSTTFGGRSAAKTPSATAPGWRPGAKSLGGWVPLGSSPSRTAPSRKDGGLLPRQPSRFLGNKSEGERVAPPRLRSEVGKPALPRHRSGSVRPWSTSDLPTPEAEAKEPALLAKEAPAEAPLAPSSEGPRSDPGLEPIEFLPELLDPATVASAVLETAAAVVEAEEPEQASATQTISETPNSSTATETIAEAELVTKAQATENAVEAADSSAAATAVETVDSSNATETIADSAPVAKGTLSTESVVSAASEAEEVARTETIPETEQTTEETLETETIPEVASPSPDEETVEEPSATGTIAEAEDTSNAAATSADEVSANAQAAAFETVAKVASESADVSAEQEASITEAPAEEQEVAITETILEAKVDSLDVVSSAEASATETIAELEATPETSEIPADLEVTDKELSGSDLEPTEKLDEAAQTITKEGSKSAPSAAESLVDELELGVLAAFDQVIAGEVEASGITLADSFYDAPPKAEVEVVGISAEQALLEPENAQEHSLSPAKTPLVADGGVSWADALGIPPTEPPAPAEESHTEIPPLAEVAADEQAPIDLEELTRETASSDIIEAPGASPLLTLKAEQKNPLEESGESSLGALAQAAQADGDQAQPPISDFFKHLVENTQPIITDNLTAFELPPAERSQDSHDSESGTEVLAALSPLAQEIIPEPEASAPGGEEETAAEPEASAEVVPVEAPAVGEELEEAAPTELSAPRPELSSQEEVEDPAAQAKELSSETSETISEPDVAPVAELEQHSAEEEVPEPAAAEAEEEIVAEAAAEVEAEKVTAEAKDEIVVEAKAEKELSNDAAETISEPEAAPAAEAEQTPKEEEISEPAAVETEEQIVAESPAVDAEEQEVAEAKAEEDSEQAAVEAKEEIVAEVEAEQAAANAQSAELEQSSVEKTQEAPIEALEPQPLPAASPAEVEQIIAASVEDAVQSSFDEEVFEAFDSIVEKAQSPLAEDASSGEEEQAAKLSETAPETISEAEAEALTPEPRPTSEEPLLLVEEVEPGLHSGERMGLSLPAGRSISVARPNEDPTTRIELDEPASSDEAAASEEPAVEVAAAEAEDSPATETEQIAAAEGEAKQSAAAEEGKAEATQEVNEALPQEEFSAFDEETLLGSPLTPVAIPQPVAAEPPPRSESQAEALFAELEATDSPDKAEERAAVAKVSEELSKNTSSKSDSGLGDYMDAPEPDPDEAIQILSRSVLDAATEVVTAYETEAPSPNEGPATPMVPTAVNVTGLDADEPRPASATSFRTVVGPAPVPFNDPEALLREARFHAFSEEATEIPPAREELTEVPPTSEELSKAADEALKSIGEEPVSAAKPTSTEAPAAQGLAQAEPVPAAPEEAKAEPKAPIEAPSAPAQPVAPPRRSSGFNRAPVTAVIERPVLESNREATSRVAVGLDLGGHWARVGTISHGELVIIPVGGHAYLPACVAVRTDGSLAIGHKAKSILLRTPERSLYLGALLRSMHHGMPQLPGLKAEKSPEGLLLIEMGGKQYELQELFVAFLRTIHEAVVSHLGHDNVRLFISVPHKFDDNAASVLRAACREVGLTQFKLESEPDAQIRAYNLGDQSLDTVLTVDVGTSHLGLGLAQRGRSGLKTTANRSNPQLSARALDEIIAKLALDGFLEQTGEDHRNDSFALNQLVQAISQIRGELRRSAFLDLRVNLTAPGGAEGVTFERAIKLPRSLIFQETEELVAKICREVQGLLRSSEINAQEVGAVVLAGSAGAFPPLAQALSSLFGKEALNTTPAPQTTLLGLARSGVAQEKRVNASRKDALAASIGIELPGGRFRALLPAGSPLPARMSRKYPTVRDNQQEIELKLFQGDAEYTRLCNKLGSVALFNLPKGPRGSVQILLSIQVDKEGVLEVRVEEAKSGQSDVLRAATNQTPQERRQALAKSQPAKPAKTTTKSKPGFFKRLFGKRP